MAKVNGNDIQRKLQKETATSGSFTALMQAELKKVFPAIKTIVPRHMTPERLARMALTTISRTPKLAQCTPPSLVGAVMNCAILGLEPNLMGHAYLVPYWNNNTRTYECQFQIGYKGYIELIRRTGEVSQIYARPVYENDLFVYLYGEENTLVHLPFDMLENLESYAPLQEKSLLSLLTRGAVKAIRQKEPEDAGQVTRYYAAYKLKDGSFGFQVVTKNQALEHARKFSSSKKNGQLVGPWSAHFDAMAMKTAIKEMVKYMPISVENQEKIALDEAILKPSQGQEEGNIFEVDFKVMPREEEEEERDSTKKEKEEEEEPEKEKPMKPSEKVWPPRKPRVEPGGEEGLSPEPFHEEVPFL